VQRDLEALHTTAEHQSAAPGNKKPVAAGEIGGKNGMSA
jgi:hypothetical protein